MRQTSCARTGPNVLPLAQSRSVIAGPRVEPLANICLIPARKTGHTPETAVTMRSTQGLNRRVVTGPRPPAPRAQTWNLYFLPLCTLALNTRFVVVLQGWYFLAPGVEIRAR